MLRYNGDASDSVCSTKKECGNCLLIQKPIDASGEIGTATEGKDRAMCRLAEEFSPLRAVRKQSSHLLSRHPMSRPRETDLVQAITRPAAACADRLYTKMNSGPFASLQQVEPKKSEMITHSLITRCPKF
ncbi:hypothetical protein EVAR_843_1 [Eumeta japonica]|uniref:Uncharacterized protein n=1 Tax=Eumeta variegata TaxID=151549 RepID=A0A4C1SGI2_EUMVA|nr:hypothetical protein EVAR_843_1 [Eumeta japonica]